MVVAWCDPPAFRTPWASLLEPLMERRGAWALVRDDMTQAQAQYAVSCLRRGVKGGPKGYVVPPGGWEFSSAHITHLNRWGVWARYLGPKEAP
jgi:hypothetical protein